ncbi:PfkB family carbohydrate kinase, partial [Deinococcus sp. MIMF12]
LDAPTGLALITVAEGGENAITVASGANARMTPGHLPADLSPFTHLLLQGELPAAVNREAARRAHAAGLTVLLNAAPVQAPDPELLAHVTHLLVNETELAALAPAGGRVDGDGGGVDREVEAQARALRAAGPEAVTVTLGARGSLTVAGAQTYALPALPVTPVDTTGAGDTFAGVLAAGLPLPGALRTAGVAASLTCTRPGAQDAMPTREEIQANLR